MTFIGKSFCFDRTSGVQIISPVTAENALYFLLADYQAFLLNIIRNSDGLLDATTIKNFDTLLKDGDRAIDLFYLEEDITQYVLQIIAINSTTNIAIYNNNLFLISLCMSLYKMASKNLIKKLITLPFLLNPESTTEEKKTILNLSYLVGIRLMAAKNDITLPLDRIVEEEETDRYIDMRP